MTSRRPVPRLRPLAGAALLAFWLGWTALALAHLRPSLTPDDPARAERALRAALDRLPPVAGADRPLALRLAPGDAGNEPAWQALAAGLREDGGLALVATADGDDAFEVLILAAGRRPVYAGPLVPDPALCGGGHAPTRLRQWLPRLLERDGPPLLLAAP